jgi:hypothetical protein
LWLGAFVALCLGFQTLFKKALFPLVQ